MDARLDFATALIWRAGQYLKDQMAQPRQIEAKSSSKDLVTDLDKAVQDFIITEILAAYPQDQIFAEEEGQNQIPVHEGAVWSIDPIDGTVNFITQQADFAIMLAYLVDGQGQFGLIYDVMADKLYVGGPGRDLTCNGQVLGQPNHGELAQSLVAGNTGLYAHNAYGLADLFNQSLGIRNYGCAGLSMVRVLTGQLWAYASYLYPWDYLPAQVMGQSLGLRLECLDGQDLDHYGRQQVIFYPQAYQDQIRQYLKN